MTKLSLSWSLVTFFLATVCNVSAQQPAKIPRIGYLAGGGAGPTTQAFRKRLKELGYVEGKNIAIEYRNTEGKGAAVEADLARELVRLNLDVLILSAFPAIRAAKEATKTIPIVMVASQDPVAVGLVDSLARPGGNLTGLSMLASELSGKRLELLKEIVPTLSRVGIIIVKESILARDNLKLYAEVARAMKIEQRAIEIRVDNPDLPSAFGAAVKERVNAIIPIRNATVNRLVPRIAELAIKHKLPTMFERIGAVESGGLASYTADELESYRRAAVYVDKILKGTKPADLPVEQPVKFEFVVNLKTAKQIGLTIPPNVLVRADRVIR